MSPKDSEAQQVPDTPKSDGEKAEKKVNSVSAEQAETPATSMVNDGAIPSAEAALPTEEQTAPAPASVTPTVKDAEEPKSEAKEDKESDSPTVTAVEKPSPSAVLALVVDDEPANRDFLVRLLQQAKLKVRGAGDGQEALAIAEELGDDLRLIMLDHQLPDKTGAQLLKELRERLPNAKIVMATMYDERSMMRDAFNAGCTAFLVKPHGFMDLFKIIEKVADDPSCLDKLQGKVFDQQGLRDWRG